MSRKMLCSFVALLLVVGVSLANEKANNKNNNHQKHAVCAEGTIAKVEGDNVTVQVTGTNKEPKTLSLKIDLHAANIPSENHGNVNIEKNANANNNKTNNANDSVRNVTKADLMGRTVTVYGDDSNGTCVPKFMRVHARNANNENARDVGNNNGSNNSGNTNNSGSSNDGSYQVGIVGAGAGGG